MAAIKTKRVKNTTLTPSPRMSEADTARTAAAIVRTLRLPPGTTVRDAEQEAIMRLCSRSDDGYEGRKLWKRVWGDMKDLYGREWKRFYAPPSPPLETGLPSPGRTTHEAPVGLQVDVREAVSKLKPGQRDVVERIAFLGLTHEETAQQLGLNTQAVTMRYARARRRLAELLEAYAP